MLLLLMLLSALAQDAAPAPAPTPTPPDEVQRELLDALQQQLEAAQPGATTSRPDTPDSWASRTAPDAGLQAWIQGVYRVVQAHFVVPRASRSKALRATLELKFGDDRRPTGATLVRASGDEPFDAAALHAVTGALPELKPPPGTDPPPPIQIRFVNAPPAPAETAPPKGNR